MSSENREEYFTGAIRDLNSEKLRYDLIPASLLKQLAEVFTEGALYYGDRNWQKGMPISRYYASAMRHIQAYIDGDEDENHLIKAAWNLMAMKWTLDQIQLGNLPHDLDDTGDLW